MKLVPGDTKKNGLNEHFRLVEVKGTGIKVESLHTSQTLTITQSEWDRWDWVRTAKQEGLF